MFDFEKLEVYKKAKTYNSLIQQSLKGLECNTITKNQLRRASLSIVLNIAEGSGRNSKADKRNFFVVARGSVFECVAILDTLKDEKLITDQKYEKFYSDSEEISKMLFGLIRVLK